MAKIGLYIPDDKMPEIEKWQDQINFSQLFREAFDREVEVQEILEKKGSNDMEKVIARLKGEQQEDYQVGREAGAKDGTQRRPLGSEFFCC